MPDILSHFSHVQKSGAGWMARCPAHDDTTSSLKIDRGAVQPWVLCCHAGCEPAAIIEAAGLTNADISAPRNGNGHHSEIVATYDYTDEHGALLYQVCRFSPKDFRQRKPNGNGGWVWSLGDVPRVVFGLPELQGQRVVYIPEGEKDVLALRALGLTATCNAGGASKSSERPKWVDAYTQQLVAAGVQNVVILPDNDDPGRSHADAVARSFHAAGLQVKVVSLPNLPQKGDVTDWLQSGHTREELVAIVKATPLYQPAAVTLTGTSPQDTAAHAHRGASDNWPAPLSQAAYHGVFGDIVRTLEPQTEADPVAVLLSLLTMFGNVVGRGPHFCAGRDTHYLNLFVGIVGQTAKGRKGMSHGEARAVLHEVAPEWTETNNTSGLSSGEGLIWAIRDPFEKKQPVKEAGRVVDYQTVIEDHGVADKRLMVVESELASVLKVMAREGNILSTVIRQAWDGKTLNVKTKSNPATATNPHISMVTHITSTELLRCLQDTDARNGFGNRFLWSMAQRSKSLPDGGRPVNLSPYVARLREAIAAIADRSIEYRRDPEASRLWHRVYDRLGAEIPGLLGAMTSRAEAQVMRLACLYAVGDMSYVVQLPHLRAALELWRYCFESARYIFGGALGDATADAIFAELRRVYPESVTKSEISRELLGRNHPASHVNRALSLLVQLNLARCERDTSGDGRPVERWAWTGDDLTTHDINDISGPPSDEAGSDGVYVVNVVASAATETAGEPQEVIDL